MAQTEKQNRKPRENRPPAYIAWHVGQKGEKAFWTRIGAAWRHDKGEGLTLQLDLVPVNDGRIVLRLPKEVVPTEEGAGA